MKKRTGLWFLFFFLTAMSFAQPYGNEWIQYNQSYFKIYVNKNGVYRIPYSTLSAAGIPLGTIDPRSFQVFSKGLEQYIFVKGEGDGVFNTTDYIEFYGEKNDGWLDTVFYKGSTNQANPYYSLFNDSLAYFLTWNSSINNRRMGLENDVAFASYTPGTWFYKEVIAQYNDRYYLGSTTSSETNDPEYTAGEGWFDLPLTKGGSITKTLSTINRYATGPPASVDLCLIGASNAAVINPDHHLRIQFGSEIIDTVFEGYGIFRFHRPLDPMMINASTSFTLSSIDDLGVVSDNTALAWIRMKYAHTTMLGNVAEFFMRVPDALAAKTYLNLSGVNAAASDSVRFYDLTNHKRIKCQWDGTSARVLIPNAGNEKRCYLVTEPAIKTVTKLYSTGPGNKFVNYESLANASNANYYILTHPSLMTDVQEYANYRSLTGYSPLIINVNDLWDQYAYGILKNPLAIKNFMHEAFLTFNETPQFLFIIGKGYRAGHNGTYPYYRKNAYYFEQTLVPAIGDPPSDFLFTNGILDNLYQPAVPTGRLAARNPGHVQMYLDKVMQYEAAQLHPEEWMKNVLHFGGGTSSGEQATYAAYLNLYKNIIEDTLFGGYVRTFLKTSSDPIQSNQSDSLKAIINNGVTLMTFFGHAAGIGFDQSLDYPSEYSNYGKYPFILANSCLAGDLFLDGVTSSEEFVLIENKGVIGYLASVGPGIPYGLHAYSQEFYRHLGYKNYRQAIGKIIQQTIRQVQSPDFVIKGTCLEMTLHGDPAVVLNSFEKPDYMVSAPNVYFEPANITTETDTFRIHVISTNLGRAINDSFMVSVIRHLPEGSVSQSYLSRVKATFFKDTITFKMPVDIVNGIGLNTFDVSLDYFQNIDEISETNNNTSVSLLIKSAAIVPVWPPKYAVVPQLPLTLKASTGYAFATPQSWVFQLDTSDAFSSPLRQQTIVVQGGGVVNWTPSFPLMNDSIVYFWRVSPDSSSLGYYNWRESSFQLIQGKHGWGQAHFHQFKDDDYVYVHYNKPARKFEFVNNIIALDCQTGIYPYLPWNEEWYKLDGEMMYIWSQYLIHNGNGMILATFDPVSGAPAVNPANNYKAWEFSTFDTTSTNALTAFINAIPSGKYVLAYSHRNHNAENWPEPLLQAFESLGSAYCRVIPNNTGYILFGKKGNPIGGSNEAMGMSITDPVKIEDSITTKWKQGTILSETVGPASSWGSLHWRQQCNEAFNSDSIHLSVIGYKTNGVSDTLIRNLPRDSGDIYNLAQRIDATEWPFLKLFARMSDDSLHTPPQMIRWQVLYEGVPETALNPEKFFYFHDDTVQEGSLIHFATATENISTYPMDSLLIKYWVVDHNRVVHPLGSFRRRAHPAGDVLIDSISLNTKDYTGLNSLWIEVNPDNDQVEQTHFNNVGEVYFFVDRDKINPMLDVTFDGVHILDGDIVSARPEIRMMVKDENKYLPLDDTADYRVWIKPPGSNTAKRVYFRTQDTLSFVPAGLPENRAHLMYRPDFPLDGTYSLLVQARDKSGNESGDAEYEISFEVINTPGITAVLNWPNPFSTATHFVFTLTGSQVPSFFMIQIMTVTGKVVREIHQDELGPIHIGKNITDYAWDGRDMYGDLLANGVYLYRVIVRLNGDEMNNINTRADQYFTKEFGKMYLLR